VVALNDFLIERIQFHLPEIKSQFHLLKRIQGSVDFALLGVLKLRRE
jgi:hypothetical protein